MCMKAERLKSERRCVKIEKQGDGYNKARKEPRDEREAGIFVGGQLSVQRFTVLRTIVIYRVAECDLVTCEALRVQKWV